MRAVHIKTPEIMCNECVAKIEKSLWFLPGVISVTASESGLSTSVMYDELVTEYPVIVSAINAAGFEVED